jgi:hypothetical protein
MLRFLSTMITPPSDDRKGWRYVQPETGYTVRSMQFADLLVQVMKHRKAYDLDLSPGWQLRLEPEMCLYNESECDDPENPQPYRSALEKEGRKLWGELHGKAQSLPEDLTVLEQEDLQSWLLAWESRIPSWGGCACRQHYYELKGSIPPAFGSREAFWSWSVEIHNAVRGRLGQPLWPFQQ